MELGPIEQNIAKQAARAGKPLPDKIANAPNLKIGLILFLDAFFDLDSDRVYGKGLNPIKRIDIESYAKFYNFDTEQTEDLFYFIRKMDNAFLSFLEKKQSKK